jgi:hypothetical protein
MPTPPYARLLVSRNGGAFQTGGIVGAAGDVVQLSSESTVQRTTLFEITDYPPSWPTPSGWSLDPSSLIIFFVGLTPPPFTLPALASYWGKWALRLTVEGGIGELGAPDASRVDVTTWVETLSASGLHDIAFGEDTQFNRNWNAEFKLTLRAIETALSLGATANATSIRGIGVSATLPTQSGQVLVYDAGSGLYVPRKLTADEITAGLTVTISGPASVTLECGATWTPGNITASPACSAAGVTAATLTDGTTTSNVLGVGNPLTAPSTTYTKTASGAVVPLSLSLTKDGVSKTSNTIAATWRDRWFVGQDTASDGTAATASSGNATLTGGAASATITGTVGVMGIGTTFTIPASPGVPKTTYLWALDDGTTWTFADAANANVPVTKVIAASAFANQFSVTHNFALYATNPLTIGYVVHRSG